MNKNNNNYNIVDDHNLIEFIKNNFHKEPLQTSDGSYIKTNEFVLCTDGSIVEINHGMETSSILMSDSKNIFKNQNIEVEAVEAYVIRDEYNGDEIIINVSPKNEKDIRYNLNNRLDREKFMI